jgi:hypothetical protein
LSQHHTQKCAIIFIDASLGLRNGLFVADHPSKTYDI